MTLTEIVYGVIFGLISIILYLARQGMEEMKKDIKQANDTAQRIQVEYVHKDEHREFKSELREMFQEIKNDLREFRNDAAQRRS